MSSTTSTTPTTPAFRDAIKFADEFHAVTWNLTQAHAAQANVKKLAEINNFRIVAWATLEEALPLDHDEVLEQLEAEIKAKIPVFEAFKEGLEIALALLGDAEHRSWWEQCQLKYSSMVCFVDYAPPVVEETAVEEKITEENNTTEEEADWEVGSEEDIWWLGYIDKSMFKKSASEHESE